MVIKKKLLIIGFVWPEPKSSAAGTRMMQLINLFQEKEFEVTFVSTAQNLEFSENLVNRRVKVKSIILNDASFDDFSKKLNPEIVLFDRFMTEEQFGWRISESCPEALKILDSEDLHCLRQARQLAVKENRSFDLSDVFTDVAKREIASILRCDLSLIISEFEMKILKNEFNIPKQTLFYLPILFELKKQEIVSFEKRKDFIFIGNFLHEPNWDCIQYLSKVIWPKIHSELPDANLLIYGAYVTQKVSELNNVRNNFLIKGRAEDALDVISNAKVLLAPLRFGAGIKGKLLESMFVGTPSVTSTIGAEGINGDLEWNGFISNEPDVFCKNAIDLYTDSVIWEQSQKKGFNIIEKRFLKIHFLEEFWNVIELISSDLNQHRQKNFIGLILQHHMMSSTKYMSKWIEEKNKKQN